MIAPLLALSALLVTLDVEPTAKKHHQHVQGDWHVSEMVLAGKAVPADQLKKAYMTFDKDVMTLHDDNQKRSFRFTLDPTKKPAVIKLIAQDGKFKDQATQGIYQLDGSKLKICVPNHPKLPPIKEFASPEGSEVALFVLEKEDK